MFIDEPATAAVAEGKRTPRAPEKPLTLATVEAIRGSGSAAVQVTVSALPAALPVGPATSLTRCRAQVKTVQGQKKYEFVLEEGTYPPVMYAAQRSEPEDDDDAGSTAESMAAASVSAESMADVDGEGMVGQHYQFFYPDENEWYEGVVKSFNTDSEHHEVYFESDDSTESIDVIGGLADGSVRALDSADEDEEEDEEEDEAPVAAKLLASVSDLGKLVLGLTEKVEAMEKEVAKSSTASGEMLLAFKAIAEEPPAEAPPAETEQ